MRRIAPMGGGGFAMEPRNPRMDRWLLSLARRKRPRVLFVATASGDSANYIERFYKAFRHHDCEPAHLALFNRGAVELRQQILSADLIYVGGGNTANLLAVWRTHGVDVLMRDAWNDGVVLCGVSAGAICWFDGGVTDSYGPELQPLRNALGLLPGSFCPHYDGESARRPAFHRHVASRALPDGYAADDGVAILFEDATIADVVRSRKQGAAYQVVRQKKDVVETILPARLLSR